MPDLTDTIETNAEGPKRVTGDTGSVEQHSLQDQIAADRYLKGDEGAEKAHRGLRFTKLVMPGGGS